VGRGAARSPGVSDTTFLDRAEAIVSARLIASLGSQLVTLPNPGVLETADRERLDWVFLGIEQQVPPLAGRWERIRLGPTATLLRRRRD
jgi:hypothetical protein